MDPITTAALVGAAGSVLGGGIGAIGSAKSNKANVSSAREQMAFQERTRANQYQTAMADMKAAGLNPILAGKLGGAGSLSGASAMSQNEGAALGESVGKASSSASEAMRLRAEIDNIKATTEKTKADIVNNSRATESLLAYQNALINQAQTNSALNAINAENVKQNLGIKGPTADLMNVARGFTSKAEGAPIVDSLGDVGRGASRTLFDIVDFAKNIPGRLKAAAQEQRRVYGKKR